MEIRDFGRLGPVSALTLGGGGIGGVLGATNRAEAVATVHAAIDAGITCLDVAPTYGTDSEAERVVGQALRERPAPEVLVTTKVEIPDDEYSDLPGRMRSSLEASLARLGRDRVDLFFAHSQLRPAGGEVTAPRTLGWERYVDEVVPAFEQLVDDGLIRGWGLTAVGYPSAVLAALAAQPRPYAAQIVVNALDLSGDMWLFGDAGSPQNPTLLAAARRRRRAGDGHPGRRLRSPHRRAGPRARPGRARRPQTTPGRAASGPWPPTWARARRPWPTATRSACPGWPRWCSG